MPEMHLRQSTSLDKLGFICSVCGPFTKNKERTQKFQETGDSRCLSKEIDKPCFHHDISYENFKQLTRRTASDKILRDKTFTIAKSPKYDGNQRIIPSMVYKFLDKQICVGTVKNESISNK